MKQFPNSMVGDLTIHVEFEDDLRVINKMFKQVKNFTMNVECRRCLVPHLQIPMLAYPQIQVRSGWVNLSLQQMD